MQTIPWSARLPWVTLAIAAIALTACSSATTPPEANPESPGMATVQMQADYPTYDIAGMLDAATLIVEGTALASENTVMEPRYEGDDPQENPLAGLSEQEKQRAIDEAVGVPATAVTFRVDTVHHGQVNPGQQITVIQTGGVIDGVTYEVEAEIPLAAEENYLLFAMDSFDGAFTILGGSAGMYIASNGGVFTAVDPDTAPKQQFTSSQVAALT